MLLTVLQRVTWAVVLAPCVHVPINVLRAPLKQGMSVCLTVRWSRDAQLLQALTAVACVLTPTLLQGRQLFLPARPFMAAALLAMTGQSSALFLDGSVVRDMRPATWWCRLRT